ncbi:MAG: ATP-binding protein [Alphaproteobacteria bacterium GM202ARS2]|nr:ATP-binding protein [Alphaproteobacteria bacterium GM202ARS2]
MVVSPSFVCRGKSHAEGLGVLLRACHDFCVAHALPLRAVSQIFVLCDEVIANIARHGYGNKTAGHITVRMRLRAGGLLIVFSDEAEPFNPLVFRATRTNTAGGFGLSLLKSFADKARYYRRRGCNVLVLWKNIK